MTRSDLLRYARVHRAAGVLGGTLVVALLSAYAGGTRIGLPFGDGLTTGIPFRRDLPLLSAVFLTAAFGGEVAAHEEMGGPALHRLRGAYVGILVVTVCAFSFAVEALAVGPGLGVVFVRSLLIWFGLATLSVAAFGPRLGWALPLASAFPLVWFGPAWWDWTVAPATDPYSWTVAALASAAGAAATAATPWRRRALLRRRRPR
ncbi:hypothetical protein [Streptomyces laurentii]|uniref:hypothetical protein n=1 Tax=Streptomyces laurentii TaxID=39478 RepID=UPI0036BCD427